MFVLVYLFIFIIPAALSYKTLHSPTEINPATILNDPPQHECTLEVENRVIHIKKMSDFVGAGRYRSSSLRLNREDVVNL